MTIRRLVALGDSVARGTGSADWAYPAGVAARLTQHLGHPVEACNVAINGLTTKGLGWQLRLHPTTRRALRTADVVLVTIGANDLLHVSTLNRLAGIRLSHEKRVEAAVERIESVLARIIELAPGALIGVTGYWNVFADGETVSNDDVLAWHEDVTEAFNTALKTALTGHDVFYVDLYPAFKGGPDSDPTQLLDGDGEHPNQAGHRVIADLVTAAILRENLT